MVFQVPWSFTLWILSLLIGERWKGTPMRMYRASSWSYFLFSNILLFKILVTSAAINLVSLFSAWRDQCSLFVLYFPMLQSEKHPQAEHWGECKTNSTCLPVCKDQTCCSVCHTKSKVSWIYFFPRFTIVCGRKIIPTCNNLSWPGWEDLCLGFCNWNVWGYQTIFRITRWQMFFTL